MRVLRWAQPASRARAKRAFIAALGVLSLAAARLESSAIAQPVDPLDWRAAPNALDLELAAATGEGVATFAWRMESTAPVVCRLDADGDGVFDHVVADCDAQKELQHRYLRAGIYFATLVARSADGQAGLARARVVVAVP